MTDEQRAAYIIAQATCAMARIAGMQAENQDRLQGGLTIAYNEKAFENISLEFGIHHNAVISLFHQ